MHSHLLLAITTLSFTGPHGFTSQTIRQSQRPTCRHLSRPCRMHSNLNFLNGTLDTERHGYFCVCPTPYSCSDDWSLSSHVISLKLMFTVRDVTMQWMFCQTVQPTSQCNIGEEALVMSGPTFPYNLVSFNCGCSDSTPLLLKERTMNRDADADYPYNYHYVCNSHMSTCLGSQSHCSSRLSNDTRYNCKCPIDRPCQEAEGNTDVSGHGLCLQ